MTGFDASMREALGALRKRAASRNQRLVLLGVSTDESPEIGVKWLERYGSFDALSVGHGWLNPSAVQYVWRDSPGQPALPQLVIVNREIEVGEVGINIGPDSVVKRVLGAEEIKKWAAAAAVADSVSPRI
jgi:hypothetical protein